MQPLRYTISVTYRQNHTEVFLAILNKAGMGRMYYGTSNGTEHTQLWIITQGKNIREEVIKQLQAVPSITRLSVIALSSPVTLTELLEVRLLFSDVGLDTIDVTDEELSSYFNAILHGNYIYYIDFPINEQIGVPVKILIRPIQEHPDFSPEWLHEDPYPTKEILDRELTVDDIEIVSESFTETICLEEPEPPPPPDNK